MTIERKNAVIAGILLLLGFSGVGILVMIGPVLSVADFLGKIPGNEARLVGGALFQLLMAFACSGIVVFLYPALKRVNETWALWSLVLRAFETVLFIIAALALLSFPALGKAFSGAGGAERTSLQAIGTLMKDGYDWTSAVLGILAWSLGALIYHVLFFKGRLIPRWLSLWGIIGAPFSIAACVLAMFGIVNIDSTANTLLTLPLGLQEIPLALWLIIKGTTDPAT
jgi:hypothetical protein